MDGEDVVAVTVVAGDIDAECACDLLRQAGIKCASRDTEEIDSPHSWFFMATSPREILVRKADLEHAKSVLTAATANGD